MIFLPINLKACFEPARFSFGALAYGGGTWIEVEESIKGINGRGKNTIKIIKRRSFCICYSEKINVCFL